MVDAISALYFLDAALLFWPLTIQHPPALSPQLASCDYVSTARTCARVYGGIWWNAAFHVKYCTHSKKRGWKSLIIPGKIFPGMIL